MEGRRSKRPPLMSTDDDKGDKQMTTRFQEQRHREESLRYVLNNHVVFENIASFLSLSDMKAASLVSRQFIQAIRGTRRFAQTAVLAITDDNLEDAKSCIRITEYEWRGVKVGVKDPTNVLEDLRRVLKSAEFVWLKERPWMKEDRAVKDATAVTLLTAVFSSTPKLSQLKLDINFLCSNVRGVLSSPAVQKTLMNLSCLDFGKMTAVKIETDVYISMMTAFENDYGNQPVSFGSKHTEDEDTFIRNFVELTELPNRLKCFKAPEFIPNDKSVDSLHCSVLRLLRNNRASLEDLELHLSVWRIQELQSLTFPALKALTASLFNLCDGEALGQFLKNQRSLEELTLTLTSLGSVGCGYHMETGIKERSVGLKKLHLAGQCFEEWDWSFLASMSRLKDFQLKMWGRFDKVNSLLASLPKNQLECLRLEELWDMWGRGSGYSRLCGVEDEFRYKTQLLQGFRCLRKLSFLRSLDAVDDQLMQWLLKEFSLLEELEISLCFKLTDAGISGKTRAEFANLRYLRKLNIVDCGVTPNGVLASCVNVPLLESLEYSNPPGPIEESVVLELVEQNPRLKRLILHYVGDVGDLGKLRAKIKKKNPRVKLSLVEGEEQEEEEEEEEEEDDE